MNSSISKFSLKTVFEVFNPWKLISHKKTEQQILWCDPKIFRENKIQSIFSGFFAICSSWNLTMGCTKNMCTTCSSQTWNKCYLDKSGVSEMFLVPFVFTVSSFISVARYEFYKNDNLLDFCCQMGHFNAKPTFDHFRLKICHFFREIITVGNTDSCTM